MGCKGHAFHSACIVCRKVDHVLFFRIIPGLANSGSIRGDLEEHIIGFRVARRSLFLTQDISSASGQSSDCMGFFVFFYIPGPVFFYGFSIALPGSVFLYCFINDQFCPRYRGAVFKISL